MSGRTTQLKYAAKHKCQNCGLRKPASQTLCAACGAKHNAATRELKARLVAEDRCSRCGAARDTARFCRACQDKHNEHCRAWRARR